jgi:hypothetical protein
MHDTRRGGLDRHSDKGGSKVATERTRAISGLTGSPPNFLGVVEIPWRLWKELCDE